jgi:hypothetical protein
MESKPTTDFKKMDVKGAFSALGSSESGLSAAEAEKRVGELGYNEVAEKRKTSTWSSSPTSGAPYRGCWKSPPYYATS